MKTRRPAWLVLFVTVALGLGATLPASAERIASKPETPSDIRAADLARATDLAARDGVRLALQAQGLGPAEVSDRLQSLSDQDLQRLASNLDQVQSAGTVPQYIWILLAIFLAVSILVMIV